MRREQPTIFYGVPTLYAAMLARNDLPRGAGSDRLRACVSAGEALPAHIGAQWRERVGVDILDGIGSTEMLHIFLSNRHGDIRHGSSGKPVPGYDARILDEDDHEVGTDEVGELVVRGPSAAEGYWNQRAKSRRTFAGEWTYTGDKYVRDADGYYYCRGRTDDMFKVSGVWVSPFEVEAALVSHEAVLEAAVIGKEDQDGLMKPKAFIVLKQGYAADARLLESLQTHVKENGRPVEIPALDRRAHRPAEDRDRQDPALRAAPGRSGRVTPDLINVDGCRIEAEWHGPPPDAAPTLVLLHEGLGCVAMWRDFPRALAERTGYGVLVYSRPGYGRSDPAAAAARADATWTRKPSRCCPPCSTRPASARRSWSATATAPRLPPSMRAAGRIFASAAWC